MCEKQNYEENRTSYVRISSREIPRKLSELTRHIVVQKNKWKDEEEATRAASCASASLQRVKESRWQQQTGAEGRSVRPRRREASSRLPRVQNKSTRNEKKRADLHNMCRYGAVGMKTPLFSHAWQNDVKASVNNTWQISPFCHMLSVGAVVLDGTNGLHEKSSRASSDYHNAESW